jgi:hypothetical protein
MHEREIVGYAETDDFGMAQSGAELRRQLCALAVLHHKHDIRPFQQLDGHRHVRVAARSGRRHFNAGIIGKHLLGGRTARLVAAADEENVFQLNSRLELRFEHLAKRATLQVSEQFGFDISGKVGWISQCSQKGAIRSIVRIGIMLQTDAQRSMPAFAFPSILLHASSSRAAESPACSESHCSANIWRM